MGSIAIEHVETALSDAADAAEKAAPGLPSDAVVWEEVEQQTSENTELSIGFVLFMVLAMQIGAVGILLDQPILIVGAMVVGPEFGPLAGLSVALVERRPDFARRSLMALGVGFPAGIVGAFAVTLLYKWTGVGAGRLLDRRRTTSPASSPSRTSSRSTWRSPPGSSGCSRSRTPKSGALIGVLISVTTIPAASNIGVAAAYGDWDEAARRGRPARRSTSARSCWPASSRCTSSGAASSPRRTIWRPARPRPDRRVGPSSRESKPARATPRCRSSCARARSPRSVNSLVAAWPPRSGVRTPVAAASSTDS